MNPVIPLAVALGSALGAMARVWLVNQVSSRLKSDFPLGTLAVNLSGALLIGLFSALLAGINGNGASTAHYLLVIGVLGSYTTVSSFSLQTLALFREGHTRAAMLNVALSVSGCLLAGAAGMVLASAAGGGN